MHIYKKITICLVVLFIPLVSRAEWKFNAYTGKQDYYEPAGEAEVADGDYGDIVISGSGAVYSLDTDIVDSDQYVDASIDNAHVATGLDAVKLGDGTIDNTELQQVGTIGATTISIGQWVFVGSQDQATYTTSTPTFAGLLLTGGTASPTADGNIVWENDITGLNYGGLTWRSNSGDQRRVVDVPVQTEGVYEAGDDLHVVTFYWGSGSGYFGLSPVSDVDNPTFVTVTAGSFTATDGETGNGGWDFDSTPEINQTCQSVSSSLEQSGQDGLTFGMPVALDAADGTWITANAAVGSILRAEGIVCTIGTSDDGDPITVMYEGWIRNDTWSFTGDIKQRVYLEETAGAIVLANDTLPDTQGDLLQILGYVTMTGITYGEVFYFDPQIQGELVP